MSQEETSQHGGHGMVDDTQIEDLESFLSQSLMGYHHLFEPEKIKVILQTPTEDLDFFNLENMEDIQVLITELMERRNTLLDVF